MEQLYVNESQPVCEATLCVARDRVEVRRRASTSSPTKSTSLSGKSISALRSRRRARASDCWQRKSACRIGL